jgi:hypothetical protein
MAEGINKILIAAIIRLLRPLVRILLRHKIPYGAFADLAKWVYVDIADREFNVQTRKQTVSRVSVITGLSRKEVARLQKIDSPDDEAVAKEYNRAVRVINGWLNDDRFAERAGRPRVIPFEGDNSFALLVKDYSGDVPAGAILDELTQVGAVTVDKDKNVTLQRPAYIPVSGTEEKTHILGTDVALLLQTIDHNLHAEKAPFFQRKVMYDNLPEEALAAFRELSAEQAQALLEKLNEYLSQQDRDTNPNVTGTGRKRAGLGIYYFEEDVDEENLK